MLKYSHKKSGFTLIELLVVIVIIGLLTSAAVVTYATAQRKSRDSSRKITVNTIASAVETYYNSNKQFPGKIDTALNPPDPVNYNTYYTNCETIDSSNNYYYYYYPLPSTGTSLSQPCNLRTSPSYPLNSSYNPSLFEPPPVWIPDLGSYLSPTPIEAYFSDSAGGNSGSVVDILNGTNGTNGTLTYMYRHLIGGYAIYTRLESSNDSDTIPQNTTISDQPNLPECQLGSPALGCLSITNSNIYMIRK